MFGLDELKAIDSLSRLRIPEDPLYPHYTRKLGPFPRLKLIHYLATGAKRTPNPCFWLDLNYLKSQTSRLTALGALTAFLDSLGEARDREPPAPSGRTALGFVCQLWYGDPRPPRDLALLAAALEGPYSTPLIDRHSVLVAAREQGVSASEILDRLTRAEITLPGCYPDLDALRSAQKRFLDRVEVRELKPAKRRRPHLLFVQAGRRWKWPGFRETRSFDVLANYYEEVPSESYASVDGAFFQRGTKFSSIYTLGTRRPELFREYRRIWFMDDDVEISSSEIEAAFALMDWEDLDLAQPAVTADSTSAWPCLYQTEGQEKLRSVTGVEIMAPMFSSRFLEKSVPAFAEAISGYGLDFLWGNRCLTDSSRKPPAVLARIAMAHRVPVDQQNGPYYQYLRAQNLNPIAELYGLWVRHGIRLRIEALPPR